MNTQTLLAATLLHGSAVVVFKAYKLWAICVGALTALQSFQGRCTMYREIAQLQNKGNDAALKWATNR